MPVTLPIPRNGPARRRSPWICWTRARRRGIRSASRTISTRSGAEIVTGSSLDLSFVRLRALSRNLRPSLDILADVVLHPSFPTDLVELAKRRRIAQIGQEKAQPVAAAQRVVPALLFGAGHAYGNPLTGSGFEQTVGALTRDDLAKWHRDWFHPGNATLIVTGDVTLAALMPELERAFGGWKAGQAPAKRNRRRAGDGRPPCVSDRQAGRAAVGDRRGARVGDAAGRRRIWRSIR